MSEITKDPALEALFRAARPTYDDGDRFMAALDARLDVVEMLEQQERARLKRYKTVALLTVALAVVFGSALVAYLMYAPAAGLSLSLGAHGVRFFSLVPDARLVAALLLSGVACFAILHIARLAIDAPLNREGLRRA